MILLGCNDKEMLSQNVVNELSSFENIAVLKETTSNINNASFFGKIDQLIAPIELSKNNPDLFNKLKPELLITIGGMVISKKNKNNVKSI